MTSRLALTTLAVAAVAGALVSVPPAHVAAGTSFTVIDDPDRALYDVSDTGQFVLVGPVAGGTKQVIDRQNGTRIDVDPRAVLLSGGGGMVVYSTTDQLSVDDTDSLADIYVENTDGNDVRLMTLDNPGWSFDDPGDFIGLDGGIAIGRNAGLGQVAPFFVSAFGTNRIDADMPPSAGGIRVFSILKTTHEVLWQRGDVLYSDDRNGGHEVMNSNHGTLIPVGDADLQPGAYGLIAAFSDANTGAIYTTSGPDSVTQLSDVRGYALADGPSVSMASTGDVAWEVPAPTRFGSSLVTARQLAMRHLVSCSYPCLPPSEATVIESQPTGGLADGSVTNGVITDDGAELVFASFATNLAGTSGARTVFATSPTVAPPGPNRDPSTFTARTPVRVLDTRPGSALGASGAMPTPGTSIYIRVRNLYGVPLNATAVAIQLTAAEGTGVGYLSAIATGSSTNASSNLNIDEPGEAIANFAIVPIAPDGSITVFTQASTHVLVDLVGWFRPSVSIAATGGRYVAVGPDRVLDTRPESLIGYTGQKPTATSITPLHVTGAHGVPGTGVTAVAVNITITQTDAVGYVQVAPASSLVVGASSTANISRVGQTVAAATIVPVDENGNIAIYTQMSTHIVVDINGWFTGPSAAPSTRGLFVPFDIAHRTDTRDGQKPIAGTRYTVGSPGSAAVGNVTATETVGPGFVQLGPTATMVSGATSNINPTKAGETLANFFIAPIDGGFDVFTSNGTHIVTDVVGHMTE